MCYGKSTRDVREIAYEMATINNIKVPDNWHRDKKAGLEWMRSFLKRNKLSLRIPEGCSLSRMTSFNKHNVDIFFTNLENLYKLKEHFANGTRVWNLDETGTTTVQSCRKIITKQGVKQVNAATSQERGTLVTTCVAINAMGSFIPPVMIFPRQHFKPHMINGAPVGTLGLANPSGWMTTELFPQVIQHFVQFTAASKENPCLLILDNHESHLSLAALDLAKSKGITVLTLPPHSSHRMQPLDVSVFGPFKAYYNEAVQAWLLAHPGIPLTIYDVASCVGTAFKKSMVPTNITKGFERAGIFPFDKTIFSDADFLCSSVTDRENPAEIQHPEGGVSNVATFTTPSSDETAEAGSSTETPCVPTTSSHSDTDNKKFLSPAHFKGFPKAKPRKATRKPREKGSSIIATSSPEQLKLKEKEEKKKEKAEKQKENAEKKRKVKQKKPRVTVTESDEEENEDDQHWFSGSSDDSLDLVDVDNQEEDITALFLNGILERPLKKDEFILVEFSENKSKYKLYYVGQYTGVTAEDGAYETKFLRRSFKHDNAFYFPNIPDIADIPEQDIKLVLPPPSNIRGTKRVQGIIKFDISFYNIAIR